jgi:phosphohistidine phosphatase
MAARLLKHKVNVDHFVSSPAKRARKTAEYFLEEYRRKEKELILVPELYEAATKNFSSVVGLVEDNYNTVAIFSHNPGITEYANKLTEVKIDNMPTCSVFAVKCDVKSWSEFADAKKTFWFFDYPKKESL